jgi:hypothetical protein
LAILVEQTEGLVITNKTEGPVQDNSNTVSAETSYRFQIEQIKDTQQQQEFHNGISMTMIKHSTTISGKHFMHAAPGHQRSFISLLMLYHICI